MYQVEALLKCAANGRSYWFVSGARTRPSLNADGCSNRVAPSPAGANDIHDANALEEPGLEVVGATAADASGASALMAMTAVANDDEGNSPGGGEQEATNPKVRSRPHSPRESLPSSP